jgi:glutamate-ammonia-ligase adenylyltransferase
MTPADVQGSRGNGESLLSADAGPSASATHSRLVQRLRRRYADELPLLPPGVPTLAS